MPLLFVVVFALSKVLAGQVISDCPLQWVLYEGNCYLFAIYPMLSYEEADKTCLGKRAGLVSVNTDAENGFLIANMKQLEIFGHELWYTSGSYYDDRLMWDGDGTIGITDDSYWVSDYKQSLGIRVAYQYSDPSYKWRRVTEGVNARYICEIPLKEISIMFQTGRDFTYGTNILDNSLAPRGPQMKIQPMNLVVSSQSIQPNIECMAYGIPQVSYTWLKEYNNIIYEIANQQSKDYLVTNGKLTFLNVSSESAYSGNYQCKVENQFGSVLSNIVRITHGFLKEFTNVIPGRFNVSLYKGTYLNCNPPVFKPAANFQWQKGSEFLQTSLNQYYFLSSDGNLYFSEVQAQDTGYYYCLVTLSSMQDEILWTKQPPSTTSKAIYLEVTGQTASDFPPEIQDAFPKVFPSTPMRGLKLELECLAYGRMPLVYSWTRIGKAMPAKAQLKDLNRILVIENAQFEDEGSYACHVTSNQGADQKSFTLALSAKPYFVYMLEDMHVDINSQLTWRCEAVGKPRPTFTWYKNSKPIRPVPGKVEITSNVLKLKNLDTTDSGMYQCAASNVYGSVFSGAQLRVLAFPPSLMRNPLPSKTLAALNGNITIPCSPEAAPAARINWLHDGIIMSLSMSDVTQGPRQLNNGDLKITRLTQSDKGVYTCQAENDQGKAETSTELEITGDVTIVAAPRDLKVNWNDTAFFRCEVSYNYDTYDLVYVWKYNGKIIDTEKDPHYVLSRNDNQNGLYIKYAQFKHDGYYECIALTTTMSTNAGAMLTVLGPPGEPSGVYAMKDSLTSNSVQLVWTRGPMRGTPVESYTIEARTTYNPVWKKVAEVNDQDAQISNAIDPEKRTCTVTGLLPYNNYTFRVFGKNAFPMPGIPSWPSKEHFLPGAAPVYPVEKVSGGGGSVATLTMTWELLPRELEGGPDIGYIAYWRKKESTSPFMFRKIDGRQSSYVATVRLEDYYLEYEIIIGVFNRYGVGPNSTMVIVYSAEDLPPHPPTGVGGSPINSSALWATWNPMENTREVIHGSILGFKVNTVDMNNPFITEVHTYIYGDVSQCAVIGLFPIGDYWNTVQVFNSAGLSFPSEGQRISINNDAPRHYPEYVTVGSHGHDSVYVKWRGVLISSKEESIDGYKLRWYPATENIYSAKVTVIKDRKTEGIIYGVEKRTVYVLRVQAYSVMGGDGRMSPIIYFTLGGDGVPVTDPAMTDIMAASSSLHFSFTLFCFMTIFIILNNIVIYV